MNLPAASQTTPQTTNQTIKPALDGVLVLSVGHTLPGLYCLAMLRDLGARIIRIERKVRDDEKAVNEKAVNEKYKGMDVTFPIRSLTAGTEALSLNLKHEKGVKLFKKLAEQADVVLEGFRPGVMQRLGIDYAALSKNKPELIYAAITGYGQSGVYKDKVGHDINYLAETGVLALTNPVGLPGVTFGDGMAGVSAALNIVAAIHGRTQSGKGQMIDCAIVDGPMSLMTSEFEYYWNTGEARSIGANHLTGRDPWYGVHSTKDGKHVALGAVEPQFYQTLCDGLGHTELASKQFAEGDELAQVEEKIIGSIASLSRDELIQIFEKDNACISSVLNTEEVTQSPIMERASSTDSITGQKLVRTPVRLPLARISVAKSEKELLLSLEFTKNEIEELAAMRIIGAT